MNAFTLLLVASACISTLAFPSFTGGSLGLENRREILSKPPVANYDIKVPPKLPYTGSKHIPDAAHPFRAPGPNDKRGPCPGLNTMANHGYLPRSGIATYAEIIDAAVEALSFDYDVAALAASLAILTRGNSYTGVVSIGSAASLTEIPPNPDGIDGTPQGLAKHGRFEGDDSLLHEDFGVTGDASAFSQRKFDLLKNFTSRYSQDGIHVDTTTMQEFKYQNFFDSQKSNPKFELSPLRVRLIYNEAAFTTHLFRNGTTKLLTLDIVESFFKHNRFPDNWFRQDNVLTFEALSALNTQILSAHPINPGKNDEDGNYVGYAYNLNDPCQLYAAFLGDVPQSLNQARGGHARNVQFFTDILHQPFASQCYKQKSRGGDDSL